MNTQEGIAHFQRSVDGGVREQQKVKTGGYLQRAGEWVSSQVSCHLPMVNIWSEGKKVTKHVWGSEHHRLNGLPRQCQQTARVQNRSIRMNLPFHIYSYMICLIQ